MREESGTDAVLRRLKNFPAALAVSLLIAAVWAPLLFQVGVPQATTKGVVQETSLGSESVVKLDDGTFATVYDVEAEPGETVTVYTAPALEATASKSHEDAWLMVGFLGGLGTFVQAALIALVGEVLIRRRLRRNHEYDYDYDY